MQQIFIQIIEFGIATKENQLVNQQYLESKTELKNRYAFFYLQTFLMLYDVLS